MLDEHFDKSNVFLGVILCFSCRALNLPPSPHRIFPIFSAKGSLPLQDSILTNFLTLLGKSNLNFTESYLKEALQTRIKHFLPKK